MSDFKYMWYIPPIDFWNNAIVASDEETIKVLKNMPEEPRDNIVYKTYVPGDTELVTVYICKADNNGDTYLFSDEDFISFYNKNARRI